MDETQLNQLVKDIIKRISPTLQPDKSMYQRMEESIKWGLDSVVRNEREIFYNHLGNLMKGIRKTTEGK